MPGSRETPNPLPEDQAAILFAQMDIAQARGEFSKAAEAQHQLELLGWVVTRRRHRRPDPREREVAPC